MPRITALILAIMLSTTASAAIPWPFEPFDSAQPIGNSYGEYQDYGGSPYLHPGIDILQPAGSSVYAVKAGWVKAILTTEAQYHWRVAIGDSAGADSCDGWLYAHLDQPTIAVSVGEHVDSGQFLGNIVNWPVAGFSHCHFVKIRNAGVTWGSNWLFVGNPLDELANIDDFDAPYFLDINVGYPFRFCVDNTDSYFTIGNPIAGNVDIIAHAHDRIGSPTWVLAPYAMGYSIYSDSVLLGPYTSFVFKGQLFWDAAQHTLFKNSGSCNSAGDYNQRQFYEIITNHDIDSLLETSDISGNWATGLIPNDSYTVKVWARDRYGNIAWDSMKVTTANFYNISGNVTMSDGNPNLSGSTVSVPFTSASTLTIAGGGFTVASQPAGRYAVVASRTGYVTQSSIYPIFANQNLNIVLSPVPYVNGDVNYDGTVNISDAVYLIQYVFGGGPAPVPWAAGQHIDTSLNINISDAVYLIQYIFAGGPPPGG